MTNSTFYNNVTNKSQTLNKQLPQRNLGIDLDGLMAKFNNSIAIQNIGQYSISNNFIASQGKSRNQNAFKTTATIGPKNLRPVLQGGGIEGQQIKGTALRSGGTLAVETIASGGHTKNTSGKFNQTMTGGMGAPSVAAGGNSNLYSMIYQNRQKNLVSSYLKGIDTQQLKQKATASSRNQPLIVPAGTKNKVGSRNAVGRVPLENDGTAVYSKSIVGTGGNRYY